MAPTSPSAATPSLLVVDDNEANRDMLSRRLEKKGYRVLKAEDGASALALIAAEPLDLVLLDIEMPGCPAWTCCREVRKTRTGLQLPILMATARSDSTDVGGGAGGGCQRLRRQAAGLPGRVRAVEAQLRLRSRVGARGPASPSTAETARARCWPANIAWSR
jgi:CheY-like chemotaxis protein